MAENFNPTEMKNYDKDKLIRYLNRVLQELVKCKTQMRKSKDDLRKVIGGLS